MKLDVAQLIETKDSFLDSTFYALHRIERGFYKKLAEIFDLEMEHADIHKPTSSNYNPPTVDTPFDDLVTNNPFDVEFLKHSTSSIPHDSSKKFNQVSREQEQRANMTGQFDCKRNDAKTVEKQSPFWSAERMTDPDDSLDAQEIDLM